MSRVGARPRPLIGFLVVLVAVIPGALPGLPPRPNVGTVLFTDADNVKDCWSMESIALLTSRMILEDLLPSVKVLNVNSEGFVADIVDYFRLILEVVRKVTYGKSKHVMLLALTDVLGGYLNHIVMPMARFAFYAGSLDYMTMKKLYQLFDEIKNFLRTNGIGWAKPIHININNVKVPPIELSHAHAGDPCRGLVYYEGSAHNKFSTKRPTHPPRDKRAHHSCFYEVPMPFFDSKRDPIAIAVPFRTFSLRNIESKPANYLLIKYYIAAVRCLKSKGASSSNLESFQSKYTLWLTQMVKPRLADEKLYAAFGGVLRLLRTLERFAEPNNKMKQHGVIGNFNLMPETQDQEHEELNGEEALANGVEKNAYNNRSFLIVLALLVTIFLWFLLGSMFICYRIRASKEKKKGRLCELEHHPTTPCGRCSSSSLYPVAPVTTETDVKGGIGGRMSTNRISFIAEEAKRTSESEEEKTAAMTSRRRSKFKPSRSSSSRSRSDVAGQAKAMDQQQAPSEATTSESKECEPCHKTSSPVARRTSKIPAPVGCSSRESSCSRRAATDDPCAPCNADSTRSSPPTTPKSGSRQQRRRSSTTQAKGHISEEVSTDDNIQMVPCPAARGMPAKAVKKKSGQKIACYYQQQQQQQQQLPLQPLQLQDKECACHSSITGDFPGDKKPFVFGYDFQTTSTESTAAAETSDGDTEVTQGGNLSK